MVKAGGILVCIVIIALDIAAGILGLEAELEQNKVIIHRKVRGKSEYSWTPAL